MHIVPRHSRKHRLRKARRLMLSASLWRKRLVFWLGAIIIGIVASYFAKAADWAQATFALVVVHQPYMPLLLSPAMFALSAWLTRRYAPAAPGSGIPQAIAARVLREPAKRRYLLGPHIIPAKIALTIVALLGGASIGREGPSVQVGAAIMLSCATLAGIRSQRGVVLAGAAAGVAAAFNTPLAGIVFAIEEMARAFEHRNSSIVLTAIVLSGAAAMSIMGNYSYFGNANPDLSLTRDLLAIMAVGVSGGVLGSLFSRLILDGGVYLKGLWGGYGERHAVRFAAFCGLLIAVIGIATSGVTYGSGYAMGNALLHGQMTPVWWQAPAKLLATVISAVSGTPGGIFSPSLSIGSAMGGSMGALFPNTPLQGVVLLAMVAYFAGVTQAPITAFVIVLEMTGNTTAAVPLIATSVIAASVGRLLCPVSLYHALAKSFIAQARIAVQNDALPQTEAR